MSAPKKGISPEQLRQAAKDLNLSVAAIAEGSGLPKSYISEFRNDSRNLSAAHQAKLRDYLEGEYEANGQDFPDEEEDVDLQLLQGLGGIVKRVSRPAIMLSEDIPTEQATKLTDFIESNRLKVNGMLGTAFERGGVLGGEFSQATENAIREIFASLALNYVAILMLQGRNIAYRIPEDADFKTLGDWLSSYLAAAGLADILPAAPEAQSEAA